MSFKKGINIMEIINLSCQGCNNACPLEITIENNTITQVSGNCCHRGIVSANTQFQNRYQLSDSSDSVSFSGEKVIDCTGCSNRCVLTVTMKDGKVLSISGEGCRRGLVSARRQLEN